MKTRLQPVLLNHNSTGSADAANLIILHGLFGDLNNWKAIATRLSDQFHVHCMDLRNHGDSPHVSGMSYVELAADVAHTCDQHNISNTFVIGHSMGGKTAMQLALSRPELITRFAVVDIGPRRYQPHHNSIIEGLQLLSRSALDSRKTAEALLEPYAPEPGVRAFLLKNLKRTEYGNYKLRVNIEEIARCYDQIADAIDSQQQYEKPVLFVKGAESDYLGDDDQQPIMSLFKNPSLKTIDGAGHWPHSEKPEVVYKILTDFFAAD